MKLTSILFIMTCVVSAGWWKTYGGSDTDAGYWVVQTRDGGYAVVGTTSSFSNGESDIWILKTDAQGRLEWKKNYGGEDSEWGVSLEQTVDDGYIITGWTRSYGAGLVDLWLLKTDQAGDTLWTRTYGGEVNDHGRGITQTFDGGYIIIGHTASYGNGHTDMWVLKTDDVGEIEWMQTYGGARVDYGWSIAETTDSGYILAGYTHSFSEGGNDLWLVKTDVHGDSVWSFTWGGPYNDWGNCVLQTEDGGYVVSGTTESHGAGGVDACLVKVSSQGQLDWANTYGTPANEGFYCVTQASDGGFVLTGWVTSGEASSLWLVKTDSLGVVEWTQVLGGDDIDFGNSLQETSDNGFIITGSTHSYGAGNSDLWLIKTNSQGSMEISEELPSVGLPISWEVSGTMGQTITLRYRDRPAGFHASVFNAAGHKVDELQSNQPSGEISWGEGHQPGIYFVMDLTQRASRKVVLIR